MPVNVLDRAGRYDNEAARAELRIRQAEVAHLTIERDAVRTALDEKHADLEAKLRWRS